MTFLWMSDPVFETLLTRIADVSFYQIMHSLAYSLIVGSCSFQCTVLFIPLNQPLKLRVAVHKSSKCLVKCPPVTQFRAGPKL